MIRLSLKYIRYFKEQSLYVLFGIIASVAILTAVNSAFETNNRMELERIRDYEGDYHFYYNHLRTEDIDRAKSLARECHIEKTGSFQKGAAYDNEENPTWIQLGFGDEGYLDIYGLELLEGRYPEHSGEIALEEWLLPYFGENRVGARIELVSGGKTDVYTVTGIFKNRAETKEMGFRYGYVAREDAKEGECQLFLKYDESMDITKLQEAFGEKFGHEEDMGRNHNLLYSLNPEYDNREYNASLFGLDGKLFGEWVRGIGLDKSLGTAFVTVFVMVILYSIFRISVQQRIREYGKMKAFGMGTGRMMLLLGSELFFMFLIGFPIGTAAGLLLIRGIYRYYAATGSISGSLASFVPFSWQELLKNGGLLLLVLLLIVVTVTWQLGRMNVIETIRGESGRKKRPRRRKKPARIWSKSTEAMMPVVLIQYCREKKVRVTIMILMLALGGTVFLAGTYMEEQTARNNRLTQISNNGTNADIRVSIENLNLAGGISDQQTETIRDLPNVRLAEPVSFYCGAMLVKEEQMTVDLGYWKNQDERNPLIASAGGHMVQETGDQFHLKTEFYGYEESMLKEQEDFVVEGSIESLAREDTIAWQALMNGAGFWNIIDLHAGDWITVRYPKKNPGKFTEETTGILTMLPEGEYADAYEERTFTIGAIVKGSVANNEQFLTGLDISAVIMPNDRFREIFDVDGYNMVSVQLADQRDAGETKDEIWSIMEGTPDCGVVDYTDEIIRQREHLAQTMILVRVIVLLLLAIGFFNILSSVNYMLVEKRRDFTVMRAMGITDAQLTRAMIGEGAVYGVIMSVLMIAFALLAQLPLKYFLDHGLLYLNARYDFHWPLALGVSAVNILLGIAAVLLPAKRVLFGDIKEELADI